MPDLPTPRHEKFAQSLAKGKAAETRRPTSPAIYAQSVIDPAKVVRPALAGLLVTTEAMGAGKPKKEAAAPAMPAGGMDF